MPRADNEKSTGQEQNAPTREPPQGGIDWSRYRMNPVQGEESSQLARALPRRIAAGFLVALIVTAAALAIMAWNRINAEKPMDESPNPELRARARELRDNLVLRIEALRNYVYEVDFISATTLRVFLNPMWLDDESGTARAISDDEIIRAARRVMQEFRAYGPAHRHLRVEAFVVDNVAEAQERQPTAIAAYDPDTGQVTVKLTAQVPVPRESGAGEAPPGQGSLGERGGAEMLPQNSH